MASGLPVLISKDVGIWREVQSGGSGFVVNHDIVEIANILEKLTEDPALIRQMSENAKKLVEKMYNIENIVTLMIKSYEDILGGRRSQGLQWKQGKFHHVYQKIK